jgi:hypothetical protein
MPNCYIFGFGGSGARVIESFTFQLAAFAATQHADFKKLGEYTYIPILVDLDNDNGNGNKTLEILRNYQSISHFIPDQANGGGLGNFFGLQVKSVNEVCNMENKTNFHLKLTFESQNSLSDFLDYQAMTAEDKALCDMLFKTSSDPKKDLLRMSLSNGFKGGPHVGSVIMSSLADEQIVRTICNGLNASDRIILIASSFGGTGASGAPLFAHMLRRAPAGLLPNANIRANIPMALISILPYFSLTDEVGSMISPESFTLKTKAALGFYDKHKDFNNIYAVGTPEKATTYTYSDGGTTQNNKAHFVEYIGGMAIFNFLKEFENNNTPNSFKQQGKKYIAYSDSRNRFDLTCFNTTGDALKSLIIENLIAFQFAAYFAKTKWPAQFKTSMGYVESMELQNLGNSPFFIALREFITSYYRWLGEIGDQNSKPAFNPFSLNAHDGKSVLEGLHGFPANFKPMERTDLNDKIGSEMNKLTKNPNKTIITEGRLLRILTRASKKVLLDLKHKYGKGLEVTI